MRHVVDAPDLHLDIDRIKAAQLGLTQRDVANSISISLSSSGAVKPNFWLGPKMASLTWSQPRHLSTQVIVYSG